MPAELAQTLKKTPLFQNIMPETLQELAANCHLKTFAKGQDIFSIGDPADVFFIILEGWVKLYRVSKEGEEAIIHVFGPGESFAEAAVFNDTKTYPVNAQALEKTTLIEIPRNFFVQKIEQDSQFALRMLGAIAARQHYLVQQLEQITTRTAPQRIGSFLIRFCKKHSTGKKDEWVVNLPYDKSIISTRLNIKPETFSRAMAKLAPYGVQIENKKILITNIEALADFCDISIPDRQA